MSVKYKSFLELQALDNATTDTDRFLVSDGGIVKYRTGAEMLSDLGVFPGVASNIQHQVKAGVAINKGQAVYVTSADGTNMIVGLASNASEATSSKTMGLLASTVSTNGFANVITEGLLAGLNTIGATAGDPVWLGTGGNLIYGLINKPYAPAHLVFIGIVTRVNANNGEIFVKVQNGFELNEIHDVDLKTTVPINGHILGFDGSLWVNKTIASWLGYTPVPTTRTITINGNTQALSSNVSFTVSGSDSTKLPLAGGTMTGKIFTVSSGTGTYDTAMEIRETGYVTTSQSAWGYSPALTFHWGGRHAKRFGMRSDGLFAVDDNPIVIQNGGTWNINVSGNAATATSATSATTASNSTQWGGYNLPTRTNWQSRSAGDIVVGQLSWKNYGNNHTIFDASASTSPDGGAVNNTNSQINWSASYPTLMGWNGANTYGVRVDSARRADSAANSDTLGGYGPNQTGGANTIVQREANGYIQNSYFYTSGGGSERNASGLSYVAGFNSSDYYIRSYNGAAVASLVQGSASGTWGISITGNADTVDGFHGDTFFRNLGFGSGYPSWNANTIDESRSGFTYANGAPHSGCIAHFGASGYGIQLNGNYNGDTFSMRSRNGDNGTWRPWKTLYTDYNMDAPNKSGTSYYQTNTWMQFNGSYGLYWPSNYGAHLHANDISSYTQIALRGSKNTYGGIYDLHSGVNGMMYDSGGNGGIYREANGRWYLYHHVGNNCTAISTSTTSSSYRAYVGGSLYAEGDIVAYSDRRKKENIVTIDSALDKVNKLRGVYYNRIDDDTKKRQIGVIAQEIQEVLPEVVTYAEDVDEYGVSYGNIVGILIEAIKEQQKQIDDLKTKLKCQ